MACAVARNTQDKPVRYLVVYGRRSDSLGQFNLSVSTACERPTLHDEHRHPGQFRLPGEGGTDGNGYFYDSAHDKDPCGHEDIDRNNPRQESWPRMWGGIVNSTCEIKCDEERGYTNTLGVVYKCQVGPDQRGKLVPWVNGSILPSGTGCTSNKTQGDNSWTSKPDNGSWRSELPPSLHQSLELNPGPVQQAASHVSLETEPLVPTAPHWDPPASKHRRSLIALSESGTPLSLADENQLLRQRVQRLEAALTQHGIQVIE
jgi:hypothetical protein